MSEEIEQQPEQQTEQKKPAERKSWPNGSAVFEAGCARSFVGVADETLPGFLGRTVREEGGWRTHRWNGSKYIDLGIKPDFAAALDRLGARDVGKRSAKSAAKTAPAASVGRGDVVA